MPIFEKMCKTCSTIFYCSGICDSGSTGYAACHCITCSIKLNLDPKICGKFESLNEAIAGEL
jgi:hypothetical protein